MSKENSIKKLLIITSGGDAPGMNAAVRASIRMALHHEIEVYGCLGGYQGLLENNIINIEASFAANCIQTGGTILKTGRTEKFRQAEFRQQAVKQLKKLKIDAIVVLGGNGSFAGAKLLSDESSIPIIGIPCTIDNDILGTEYTIGFDTACNTALDAIDRIRDTASSLDRHFMIEVMGRNSGFLAVSVGMAGGAEIISIPEFPLSTEQIADKMKNRRREKLTSIMVVAEANQPGHSMDLAQAIKKISGIDYHVCILGHTQRGGAPTVRDRNIASLMGAQAIRALMNGESKQMLSYQQGKISLQDFPPADNGTRYFSDKKLLEINEIICDL